MLEFAAFILLLTAISFIVQDKVGIPTPITIISTILAIKALGLDHAELNSVEFDKILLMLLPLLLAVDVLSLTLEDLKKNWFSLVYAAVISVFLSILVGVGINQYILPEYNFSIPILVMLFCAVSATDPIAVCSVFSNFKLPHQLKVIAEGESLFNDAVVLVVFGIALSIYQGEIESGDLVTHSIMVIVGAILVGVVTGFVGIKLMHLSNDPVIQASIMLSVSYFSFAIAEHYHWSGILAVIVSLVLTNHIVLSMIKNDELQLLKFGSPASLIGRFTKVKSIIKDKTHHEMIIRIIKFGSAIASTVLFVMLSHIIDVENILKYWKEALAVFLSVTAIRAVMMSKFAIISNSLESVVDINIRWWSVLTFAGVKGALSVLMVHMIPNTFEHKEMFEAIVAANIILTTFLYSIALIVIISKNKLKFEKECSAEAH